eukprot:4975261-Amphidinium_carterae.1
MLHKVTILRPSEFGLFLCLSRVSAASGSRPRCELHTSCRGAVIECGIHDILSRLTVDGFATLSDTDITTS